MYNLTNDELQTTIEVLEVAMRNYYFGQSKAYNPTDEEYDHIVWAIDKLNQEFTSNDGE